jgi:CRISPR-associated protein Cas2
MPMTVVVTRDVPDRYRGFLASVMLEIAPGVYTAPRLSASVRERIWEVLEGWWRFDPGRAIVMTWPDREARGGQVVSTLGIPAVFLHDEDGLCLAVRSFAF